MIITLEEEFKKEDFKNLEHFLTGRDYSVTQVKTQKARYIIALGGKDVDIREVGHHDAVKDVHIVSEAYKLVSKKWKPKYSTITFDNGAKIGASNFQVMAGPCSIETEEEAKKMAECLKSNNIGFMRGGAFKPRTSPYSFRGLGLQGLKMFYEVAKEHNLCVVSEVVSPKHIEAMYPYIDIYQVGTRNSQNFDLLHELGAVDKPVLLKRGMSGTLEELLQSAEYMFANGNEKIILCERGIRTFEKSYRNTLDLNAIPVLKEKTHLPVIVDPSHGIGLRRFVEPMTLASKAVGADGVILEVHSEPEKAFSDGQQTLNFKEFEKLLTKLNSIDL